MKNAFYIRMPRCGSTSIHRFLVTRNIKSFGGLEMGFWGDDSGKNTSQQLYKCVSNYIGEDIYKDSFIFTSVRNPYSRAVSMYKHRSWWSSTKSFKDFCYAIKKEEYPSDCAKWHSSTLTEHIFDKDNNLKVDYVIKLENIQEDFNTVCDKIEIARGRLAHLNKRVKWDKRKHYTEHYDDEKREIIAEKYAKDIEHFGYEFGV